MTDVALLIKKGDVDGLIDTMRHGTESQIRKEAAKALETIKDDRMIEPLIQALKEEKDDDVRWSVAIALSSIGGDRAVEPFRQALKDKSNGVRRNAASFLLWRSDKDATERIAGLIADKEMASYAVEALVKLSDVDRLIQIMKNHGDGNVRDKAMFALVRLRDPRLVEILISALKNDISVIPHRFPPGRVAFALEQLGDKGAIPYLVEIIKKAKIIPDGVDPITSNVYSAVSVLGDLGNSSYVPLLENLKQKILDRGIVKEYVNTGIAAGWISTNDTISMINISIEKLKKNTALQPGEEEIKKKGWWQFWK